MASKEITPIGMETRDTGGSSKGKGKLSEVPETRYPQPWEDRERFRQKLRKGKDVSPASHQEREWAVSDVCTKWEMSIREAKDYFNVVRDWVKNYSGTELLTLTEDEKKKFDKLKSDVEFSFSIYEHFRNFSPRIEENLISFFLIIWITATKNAI